MKFQVDTCPLCGEVCKSSKIAGATLFGCPTQIIDFPTQSHYRVNVESEREVQHILIYPYSIDSFAYINTSRSRVYYSTGLQDGLRTWKLLMEVPLIRAEPNMLDRINKLITFL